MNEFKNIPIHSSVNNIDDVLNYNLYYCSTVIWLCD